MIGHLPRSIPDGYMRARRTGNVDRMDPSLGEYYGHLRLVTSGPVFTLERWQTILNFHLGKYDYLLDEWESRRSE